MPIPEETPVAAPSGPERAGVTYVSVEKELLRIFLRGPSHERWKEARDHLRAVLA